MCRNPACANFGIKYTGPSSPGRLDLKTDRFHCKACDMSFELKSNLAVRAIARYFLPPSLAYAECSNPECVSHGRNVFESYTGVGLTPPPPRPGVVDAVQHRRHDIADSRFERIDRLAVEDLADQRAHPRGLGRV